MNKLLFAQEGFFACSRARRDKNHSVVTYGHSNVSICETGARNKHKYPKRFPHTSWIKMCYEQLLKKFEIGV